MNRMISFSVVTLTTLVIMVLLSSCSIRMPEDMIPVSAEPPAERVFMPVDYKKWASGMYADEFIGKAVLVEGYYQKSSTAQYTVSSDINFFVREKSLTQLQQDGQKAALSGKPSTDWLRPRLIPMSAPLSMRDQIYPIADDQKVRVYGVVVNPHSKSIFTRQVVSSSLLVKVERIEAVQKE